MPDAHILFPRDLYRAHFRFPQPTPGCRNGGGFLLFNLASTGIALLVMLPATFCAGMTLPLITYRLLRTPTGERAVGLVYAVNTLGAIARQRKDNLRAEVLFRQAADMYLRAKGEAHPETIMVQANHLAAVRDLGRTDEAVAGFSGLRDRAEAALPGPLE